MSLLWYYKYMHVHGIQLPHELLFFDALSGEFYPSGDTEGRAHTLGRLAIAVVARGELLPFLSSAQTEETRALSYTPSWAPDTLAVALCDEREDTTQLWGLHLSRTDGTELQVYDTSLLHEEHRQLRIVNNAGNTLVPLQADSELHRNRELVTAAAQEFFG
jgi:hypothetical protein